LNTLLNEAGEILERMIRELCKRNGYYVPRIYSRKVRKDYLKVAKSRKNTTENIRKCIKKQLQYVRRDLGHLGQLVEYNDCILTEKQSKILAIIGYIRRNLKTGYI